MRVEARNRSICILKKKQSEKGCLRQRIKPTFFMHFKYHN